MAQYVHLNRDMALQLSRVHVRQGADWGQMAGTDYWLTLNPNFDLAAAASTATALELAEAGWIATSLVNTAGSGADFGSSSDKGTPNHLLTNASGDLLKSPVMFGDYSHMDMARKIAGRSDLPRVLIAEFMGSMTVASANEPRSGWGFVEDGGSPATEADQAAWISSDSAFFQIGANAGTPVNGAASDTAWHQFKIVMDRVTQLVTWYIDGTKQTMSTTLAIVADEAPYSFGFHALTTNRPALGLLHIYYDWGLN